MSDSKRIKGKVHFYVSGLAGAVHYDTLCIYFVIKYFLAFWGITILYNLLKPFFIIFAKIKKALQYLSQRADYFLAPRVGFEPTTLRLTAGCSTVELPRNITM